jgi:hypothetical protein
VAEPGQVRPNLRYDRATRKAVVTIVGLRMLVEDTVELLIDSR